MTNYYIEKDNKIIFVDTDLQRLQNTIIGQDLTILETERPIVNFEFADTPEYLAKKEAEEKAIRKAELQSQIDELDKKRVRAIAEPELKDGEQTWLEYYTSQIQELRTQIAEL